MTGENKNIIRKASIGIHKKNTGDAFRLQEETVSWWNSDVLPAIERELENFSNNAETVVIPKLDIIVDAGKDQNWQSEALPLILNKLREQLSSKVTLATPYNKSPARFEDDSSHTDLKISSSYHFITVLATYLSSGILPWHTQIRNKEEFIQRLADVIRYDPAALRQLIQPILKGSKSAQERLIYLLSGSTISVEDIYPVLFPAYKQLVLFIKSLKALIKAIALSRYEQQQINAAVSTLLFDSSGEPMEKDFIALFREILMALYKKDKALLSNIKTIGLAKPYSGLLEELKTKPGKEDIKPKKVNARKEDDSTQPRKDELRMLDELIHSKEKRVENASEETPKVLSEEGVYIYNAGLVLAAPFLNMLFEKTGIAKDYKITDADTAVCLAGYLATGKTEQAEFELLLPKLLCGVPVETVIDTSVVLEQDILNEADEMLKSLIGHWSVLGDTSVEGLRASFLLRDGKLSFRNNEWLLQVEQKAYDMLLLQIPWNYRWIKLQWMPYLLRTEWVS